MTTPHPIPTITSPTRTASNDSSATASEDDSARSPPTRLARPKIGSRKSSGSMIVSREDSRTIVDDVPDPGDVRSMSPRRNSAELDQLGEDARRDLLAQARTLQASLQAIVERVESVKSEHEKLEGGNKFLQSYVSYHVKDSERVMLTGRCADISAN